MSPTAENKPEKVKGSASYFPSIEKKHGKPIDEWMKILKKCKIEKHIEMVLYLKQECEMGHGHADALVAYFRAQQD